MAEVFTPELTFGPYQYGTLTDAAEGVEFKTIQYSPEYVFENAEAEAYVTAMTVEPDDARKALIDQLVGELKTDGIWTKLDWLSLLAAHAEQAGRLNAKNPTKALTAVSAPTFTVDRGFAGNGTSSYLDFGEQFDAIGNNFAQNSASLGAWCNEGTGTTSVFHVASTGTGVIEISAQAGGGSEAFKVNDAVVDSARTSVSKLGHRTASRIGATVKRAFFNGVRVADLTTASSATPDGNGWLLRRGTNFSADRLAAAYFGGGLTDTDVANMHTHLNTYLTAIGAN